MWWSRKCLQFYCTTAFVLLTLLAVAMSTFTKHSHTGVLTPYTGEPLSIELTSAEKTQLQKGSPIMRIERDGLVGSGTSILNINGPPDLCMEKISNISCYPNLIPSVHSVDVYEDYRFPNGNQSIGASFVLGAFGVKFRYNLLMKLNASRRVMTWTLDYSRASDIDDCTGHWQIDEDPNDKNKCRLIYSSKVKLMTRYPDFLIKQFTKKSLEDSITWVKRETENQFHRSLKSVQIESGDNQNSRSTEVVVDGMDNEQDEAIDSSWSSDDSDNFAVADLKRRLKWLRPRVRQFPISRSKSNHIFGVIFGVSSGK